MGRADYRKLNKHRCKGCDFYRESGKISRECIKCRKESEYRKHEKKTAREECKSGW